MVKRAAGLALVLALSGCLTRGASDLGLRDIYLSDPSVWSYRITGTVGDEGAFFLGGAVVGDLNGDGIGDLIMSAAGADYNNRANCGAVYVRFGGASFPVGDRDLSLVAEFDLRFDGVGSSALSGFGRSLALGDLNADGFNDLLIGDQEATATPGPGSVYVVFGGPSIGTGVRDFSQGGYSARLIGQVATDRFGDALAVGDVNGDGVADLVAGAPFADPAARSNAGAAYVFFGGAGFPTGSVSASTADIVYQGRAADDALGWAVAVVDVGGSADADVVVAAPSCDDPSVPAPTRANAGALFIMFGGTAIPTGTIDLAVDANSSARFQGAAGGDNYGASLAVGDVDGNGASDMVVGAPLALGGGGRVYVYQGGASGPGDTDALVSLGIANAFGPAGVDAGRGVAVVQHDGAAGADLIIGAPLADFNGRADSGSVYVVSGGANLFVPNPNHDLSLATDYAIRYDGAAAGDRLGDRFSIAGGPSVAGGTDELFLAAASWDLVPAGEVPRTDCGAVYGFLAAGAPAASVDLATFSPVTDVRFLGAAQGSRLDALFSLADLNGDGIKDAIFGSSRENRNNRANSGTVYVVFGGSTLASGGTLDLTAATASLRIDGAGAGDSLGDRLFGMGDINGDGIDDLILGARLADNAGADSGSVYVLFGRTTWAQTVFNLASLGDFDVRIDGAALGDNLGFTYGVGDLNGDGLGDLLLGAPFADPSGRVSAGSLFVLNGRTVWPSIIDLSLGGSFDARLDGATAGELFGFGPVAADFDGDGLQDLFVSAPLASYNGRATSGSAYLIYGRSTPLSGTIDLAAGGYDARLDGERAGDFLGNAIQAADLDLDGKSDVTICAPGFDVGSSTNLGQACVIYGRAELLSGTIDLASSTLPSARIIGSANTASFVLSGPTGCFRPEHKDLVLSQTSGDVAYVIIGWNNRYEGTLDLAQGAGNVAIRATHPANRLSGTPVAGGTRDLTGDGIEEFTVLEQQGDGSVWDAGALYVVRR